MNGIKLGIGIAFVGFWFAAITLQIAIRDELTRIIGSKIGRVFEVKPNV